jgi:glycerol-3-phosphate acyltransferase PlsY
MLTTIIWFTIAFFCGALPFSVWVGRLALHTDIRQHGDGNPGATNVLRSGSRGWAIVAVLLDSLKGAIPVGWAYFGAGLTGWPLVAVALAPVLGHAFSPFLGFRGGKAVAVTFGIWTGLTLWAGPTVLGLALGFWFVIIVVSGWAMMLAMFSLLAYLLFFQPEAILLVIWAGNALILTWKHRTDLIRLPGLRPWLKKKGLIGTEGTEGKTS